LFQEMNTTGCPPGFANDEWIDKTRVYSKGGVIDLSASTRCTLPIEALKILCDIWTAFDGIQILSLIYIIYVQRKNRRLVFMTAAAAIATCFQIALLQTYGVPGIDTNLFWGLTSTFTVLSMITIVYQLIVVLPSIYALKLEISKDTMVRIKLGIGVVCVILDFVFWAILLPLETDPVLDNYYLRAGCVVQVFLAIALNSIAWRSTTLFINLVDSIPDETKTNDLKSVRKIFTAARVQIGVNGVINPVLWILIAAVIPFYWYLVLYQFTILNTFNYSIWSVYRPKKKVSGAVAGASGAGLTSTGHVSPASPSNLKSVSIPSERAN
jgi:hypothetical protein